MLGAYNLSRWAAGEVLYQPPLMVTRQRHDPRHAGGCWYPRLLLIGAAKSWMPASAGMTGWAWFERPLPGRLVSVT